MNDNIFSVVANGNADAERLCRLFCARCHLWDDVEDKDKPVTDDRIVHIETQWTLEMTGNQFWLAHRSTLGPLMVLGMVAWRDANRLGKSADLKDQIAADVLKAKYHDVLWATALLTGGVKKLMEITSEFREFDFEERH